MGNLNYFAIVVAAVAPFLLGFGWYNVFQNPWMRAAGLKREELEEQNMTKVFGFSLLFFLIMSANLAMFLNDPNTDAAWGATAGFLAGFGWVTMALGVNALFERKSWTYIFINGGYMTLSFVLMGFILGVWR